jgi:hypothetical protein
MKTERHSIDLKMVITVLILVNVPLWGVAFFTVDQAHSALENKLAADFRAIVKKNAVTINYAINHIVANVGTIAISPTVREVLRKQNASYPNSPQEIQRRISSIDKIWLTPQANPTVEQILSNPASKYVRQFITVHPRFKRITITDRFGAVATANVKTVDYDQADEAWWRNGFKEGITGSVLIEDVTVDPIAKINALHIVVPVQEEGQDLVIGVIGAILDISDLFPLVSGVKIGSTGETLLVKEDGTIISGAEMPSALQEKLLYFDDIKAAMEASTRPDFITATSPGGQKKIVAYADTGLSANYPALKWIAMVAQDTNEANAAIDTMIQNLLWAALVVLIVITALALYLSTHRRLQFTDLHEAESN